MGQDQGASVPDQALVSDQAPAGLDPSGFDPSRGMTDDEVLDFISDNLKLESWFEGRTLTAMVRDEITGSDRFVKLRLTRITDKPSAADLRGEPE